MDRKQPMRAFWRVESWVRSVTALDPWLPFGNNALWVWWDWD
jgi:hypothetical protein